ncbi:MAG: AAA family ATPase [Candidatus Micrarchaeia archaeon]
MGKRRRRIVKKVMPKKSFKIFQCPICNEQAVIVNHEKDSDYAIVKCASCGISMNVRWYRSYDNVDAYSEFYDAIMEGRLYTKPPTSVTNESLERNISPQKDITEQHLKNEIETYTTSISNALLTKLNKDHFAKIVSFINYKGGVGKTTLAVEISAVLAQHYNKKVLLIDSDPQTNATFYLMERWLRMLI